MLHQILEEELSRLGLQIPEEVQDRLLLYIQELERWSRTINLTSLQGGQLVRRLVTEPIWIGQKLQVSGNVADIGSGNGSPGIPLYLGCGLKSVHLIEVRARRAASLRHMAAKIGEGGVLVHRTRLQDLEAPLPTVGFITLQAIAPSPSLVAALRQVFQPTTRVVWITAKREPPVRTALRTAVRGSEAEAWVFGLDQFEQLSGPL